jgi:hypothetical protein
VKDQHVKSPRRNRSDHVGRVEVTDELGGRSTTDVVEKGRVSLEIQAIASLAAEQIWHVPVGGRLDLYLAWPVPGRGQPRGPVPAYPRAAAATCPSRIGPAFSRGQSEHAARPHSRHATPGPPAQQACCGELLNDILVVLQKGRSKLCRPLDAQISRTDAFDHTEAPVMYQRFKLSSQRL